MSRSTHASTNTNKYLVVLQQNTKKKIELKLNATRQVCHIVKHVHLPL